MTIAANEKRRYKITFGPNYGRVGAILQPTKYDPEY
jgi:hypothetical protein